MSATQDLMIDLTKRLIRAEKEIALLKSGSQEPQCSPQGCSACEMQDGIPVRCTRQQSNGDGCLT